MAIVCPNGHVNDDANRFCDQCGLPLKQDGAPAATAVASAPSASGTGNPSVVCPVCGQENVPGTAFCDNCGAALPPPAPVADLAAAAPVGSAAGDAGAASGAATITCPQCGSRNDVSNRFCDNCGAALAGAAGADQAAVSDQAMTAPDGTASASTPLPTEGTTMPSMSDAMTSAGADDLTTVPSTPPTIDTTATPAADVAAIKSTTQVAPEDVLSAPGLDQTTATAPDQSQPAPPAPSTAASGSEADRARLEQEVATQQQLVTQLEQLETQFGAALPPALRQGLDEARAALFKAQADLAALPLAAPPVDPAEVARLEQEVATQQQLVTQLEQLETQFGAALPPALRQGLDEARAALSKAQADLAALTGSGGAARPLPSALDVALQKVDDTAAAPAAATAGASRTYDASAAPAAQPEAVPAQPAAGAPIPATPPARGTDQLPPAPAAPQAGGPRLISSNGKAISLPRNVGDLIIGREDPVSGIHPEIDLTPHGGEAGGVSRRHAMLREQNGQWMLTDLDSTNYTRVDGNRIAPNTPTPLRDGVQVQFGRVEFEFRAA